MARRRWRKGKFTEACLSADMISAMCQFPLSTTKRYLYKYCRELGVKSQELSLAKLGEFIAYTRLHSDNISMLDTLGDVGRMPTAEEVDQLLSA